MSLDNSVIRHNGALAIVGKCRITRKDADDLNSIRDWKRFPHIDEIYVDMEYYYLIDNDEKKAEIEKSGEKSLTRYMRDQFRMVKLIKKSGGYLDGITINKKMYLATPEFAEKFNFIEIK